jgi:hypothetical protein
LLALLLVGAAVLIGWRFNHDQALATARAAQGGVLLPTRCGLIEYQDQATSFPLLVVLGSGCGHDQGMAFARTLARHGVRVIAMSRFGYLGTPIRAWVSDLKSDDRLLCSWQSQTANFNFGHGLVIRPSRR